MKRDEVVAFLKLFHSSFTLNTHKVSNIPSETMTYIEVSILSLSFDLVSLQAMISITHSLSLSPSMTFCSPQTQKNR